MPASDYICKIPTLTPKLWLFQMPDIQNYLLGFRRAVQSYKPWFLNKSSSGSKDQNNTLMMQLLEWAKPDLTMKRNYKERPQNLLEFFVHVWNVELRFLFCNQTALHQKLTRHSQGISTCVIVLCLSLLRSVLTTGPMTWQGKCGQGERKWTGIYPQVIKARAWIGDGSGRFQPTRRRGGKVSGPCESLSGWVPLAT